MISLQTKNAYSEVFELIKNIDKKDLDRIPMNILMAIKENRNVDYKPKIDLENINKSLSKDAQALYIGLYQKYMVQDKNEVQAINKILYDNEMKKNRDNNYNFFNQSKGNNENKKEEIKELVIYKESFIKSIINKIKEVIRTKRKTDIN